MAESTTQDVLRNYFGPDQPFGPINASRITDPEACRQLFDTENKVYAELTSHPSLSLIVGRRGSGKTALLRSELLRNNYAIALELPAAESFQQVVKSIEEFPVRVSPAESVSKVWSYILWIALLTEIRARFPGEAPQVHQYLDGLHYGNEEDEGIGFHAAPQQGVSTTHDPYVVMREVLRKIRRYANDHMDGDAIDAAYDFVERLTFGGASFQQARQAAIDCLGAKGPAIILMDSLDDFKLEHEANQNSLRGLLRCQAEFHAPNQPCTLRCCLPAELMNPIYMHLSDNPLKDFGNKLNVTWRAHELLRIAAHRFRKYIQFNDPESFEAEFRHYQLEKPEHLKEFWQRVMPQRITNRFGSYEDPTAMILRHTQLLPRQLLVILNSVAVQNHRITGHGRFDRFEEQAVCEGLQEAENTICREIFNAYRSTYPGAEDICKRCVPFFPFRFRDGELHAIYNRHGKAVPFATDYEDFRTILVGIGGIGRVTKETDRYIEGEFMYSTNNNLNFQGNELLCVHPAFSNVFGQGSSAESFAPKVVYPHAMMESI